MNIALPAQIWLLTIVMAFLGLKSSLELIRSFKDRSKLESTPLPVRRIALYWFIYQLAMLSSVLPLAISILAKTLMVPTMIAAAVVAVVISVWCLGRASGRQGVLSYLHGIEKVLMTFSIVFTIYGMTTLLPMPFDWLVSIGFWFGTQSLARRLERRARTKALGEHGAGVLGSGRSILSSAPRKH